MKHYHCSRHPSNLPYRAAVRGKPGTINHTLRWK
jgi:hypothetical protein